MVPSCIYAPSNGAKTLQIWPLNLTARPGVETMAVFLSPSSDDHRTAQVWACEHRRHAAFYAVHPSPPPRSQGVRQSFAWSCQGSPFVLSPKGVLHSESN